MIKKLFFTFGLLTPGLAYGADPSADLSIQVVPPPPNVIACDIGPSYPGSVPAGARAAGFTHCAANYDFTSSQFSNKSIWLDCAGASRPLWWLTDGNCARLSIASDGVVPQVLDMHFQAGDGPQNFGNQIHTQPANGNSSQGVTFPLGKYVEVVARLPAAIAGTGCPAGQNCLYGDIWSWQGQNDSIIEMDFIEIWVNGWAHGSLIDWYPSCRGGPCYFGDGNAGSNIDTTQYHTFGFRATADGAGKVSACEYRDGTFISCTGGAPVTLGLTSDGGQPAQQYNRSYLIMNSGSSALTSGTSDLYVQRLTVWECANWLDPANPGIANDEHSGPHQCNGTVLTGAP